jgi:hypothetical protein
MVQCIWLLNWEISFHHTTISDKLHCLLDSHVISNVHNELATDFTPSSAHPKLSTCGLCSVKPLSPSVDAANVITLLCLRGSTHGRT